MPFSDDGLSPEPTAAVPDPPLVSNPTHADLAAVAATVSVVGIVMALLVAWLILRLRRVPQPESDGKSLPRSPNTTRPSFAPSEASSKFAFVRKPLRLSHRQQNGSWDFADPDPFSRPKENPFDRKPSQKKHRPSPLLPTSAYNSAGGNYFGKDDTVPWTPTTPVTPASVSFVDPPPPAYCTDSATWPLYHSKDLPPLSPK